MAFTTRNSLLARVRNGDEVSWKEFYETYKPLIILCGKDHFLTQDEIEELISKVMNEIFQKKIVSKYDPDKVPDHIFYTHDPKVKGRFHHYLRAIIRNHAVNIFKQRRSFDNIDDINAGVLPIEDKWETLWKVEWHRHLLTMAMDELRNKVESKTFAAFEMYAIQEKAPRAVADFFNMSVSSVYTAKSRCVDILKEIIKRLEEE